MSWSSVVDCSVNPMIAQGGTWLIPRQGWCPGLRSKLIEHEITQWVTPGKTETILWQFSKGGEFHFGCLLPGHFEAGMSGRINVTAR
mgnify:CR=1 FL=1